MSRRAAKGAWTVCASAAGGCICGCACRAGTSVAATTRRTGTPPPTSVRGQHPLIQSYERGEDWWYCYIDDFAFTVDGAPSFAHR